jgi:hypothetical protein
MSIQGISSKFKALLTNREVLLALLIIVVSLVSFALGRLSVSPLGAPTSQNATVLETGGGISPLVEKDVEKSKYQAETERNLEKTTSSVPTEGGYVASKNGTKYHLPWCGGAKQIKEENKVYFKTKEAAEKAGYTPASNCKGI